MKRFFNLLTSMALRFRAITLLLVLVVIVLGAVGATQLKQELIPPIELPFTIILGQASGMNAEQVMQVVTLPLEEELSKIPELVNIESTTTGAFGVIVNASNEFGIDKARLNNEVQAAIDRVWLPTRRIEPAAGQDSQAFAVELLADVTPEMLIYLNQRDSNFLFQLSPDIWAVLPEETVRVTLAYLAAQVETGSADKNALQQVVDQEIIPRLDAVDQVARVSVGGGQALPDEQIVPVVSETAESTSLLLRLSGDVWALTAPRMGMGGALDQGAVEALADVEFVIPQTPPALPDSWQQFEHFRDVTDLLEMRTLTRGIAGVFNSFYNTGRIVGGLGQTDDLAPEVVERMLAIEPSMVEYFQAEHLAAMSPEVFAVLPEEYIANLDGFTRDALAATVLAESITGEVIEAPPVDLPAAWRISPPQIFNFSFDDVPLVVYSIYGDFEVEAVVLEEAADNDTEAAPVTAAEPEQQPRQDIPEGPALPFLFSVLGGQFGAELNTADDLINITLPSEMAAQFGSDSISAAEFLNLLVLLSDAANLPPDAPALPLDVSGLIGTLNAGVISFIIEHDPTFLPNLSPAVYDRFSTGVLALPEIRPPLDTPWNALAARPQFAARPLRDAQDVLEIGGGSASSVLNAINASVPEQFAGYEVRLFDSLTPGVVRYFAVNEPGFYANLDTDVLRKFSPDTLSLLPDDFVAGLDADIAAELAAVAAGEQASAMMAIEALYASDVPPGDPNAPALNEQWGILEPFYGIELDSADDFFRFPDGFVFESPAAFMNSIFNSPQGASFAPGLFGNMTVEMVEYMLNRDPAVFNDLLPGAVREFSDEVFAILPASVQQITEAEGEPFVPSTLITRNNGQSSLLVTVTKTTEANNVEAFYIVDDIMREIDAQNDNIQVAVALETASFVEDSITGVAREGTLGAVFAIIIILMFLSDGVWAQNWRRMTGSILVVVFTVALAALVISGLDAAGGDVGRAFSQADTVVRVMFILGIVSGLVIRFWPGSVPNPAWRSTLVTTVSIPLSILTALALMNWLPPFVNMLLAPMKDMAFFAFVLRLFPENLTLNIMTLSGLTVAIGRVVDDSIVVLENIFREIQAGGDKRQAILTGTRDVSVAIFSATMIVMVVFLPLGLTGGLISEFFLPFGLTVSYALIASFFVAVTVVPVLAYMFIREEDIVGDDAGPIAGRVALVYLPTLRWALSSWPTRLIVMGVALASMAASGWLFSQRPFAFLPEFGDPEIQINVEMPAGTRILETNALAAEMERYIQETIPADDIETLRVSVGGGGFTQSSLIGGGSVSENVAVINVKTRSQDLIDQYIGDLRTAAEGIFGEDNVIVSRFSLTDGGGFSNFELVMSGPQEELIALEPQVIGVLNNLPGLANVSSNLSDFGGDESGTTFIRINRESALKYTGEPQTEDTITLIQTAVREVQALDLPAGVTVSEGFQSQTQTEGFSGIITAIMIAGVIVIFILMIAFQSVVHWFTIFLSVLVAPIGAAIALTLTNESLGIPAMIGLLMLIGLVVANAVVLIDRVQSNRSERGITDVHEALMNAGDRRLRPILMTTLATIIALIPLAVGLSEGAIIASQLGIVVIGGVTSSMLLTLIVVPVAYRILDPLHQAAAAANPLRRRGRMPAAVVEKIAQEPR